MPEHGDASRLRLLQPITATRRVNEAVPVVASFANNYQ
jgi:hypothetical protein